MVGLAAHAASAARTSSAGSGAIATIERQFLDLRDLKDAIDVMLARGLDRTGDGVPLPGLAARYRGLRPKLRTQLGAVASEALPLEERRALETMRRTVDETPDDPLADSEGSGHQNVDCAYDPERLAAGPKGSAVLRDRVYACFGQSARSISVRGGAASHPPGSPAPLRPSPSPQDHRTPTGGDESGSAPQPSSDVDEILDRLTILSRLGETEDGGQRKQLFLALSPVWRSINGDNGLGSPYRVLARRDVDRWRSGESPAEAKARELGIPPQTLERWLIQVLEAWRDTTPQAVEPWDFWFAADEASRILDSRVPVERLRELNDRFYRSLGADPAPLGIQYDLAPRPGKTPVAYTTFGQRRRERGGVWGGGAYWVFATYRAGGLGNLVELLHETGHGIHIAAIRTRPAFADWPDSDVFTEALGDLLALEAYEPEWQEKYLGTVAPLAHAIRAKYASIVLDVAWALFEWRVHRDPMADPNQVWTDLTREYLRIVPHPELSWWAMRGQLVNSPGYMMNYAAGALLVADLRARCRALRGPFSRDDPGYYDWLAERFYRFGLERPSQDVVADFLGRPLSPDALLADLGRAQTPRQD